MIQTLFGFIAFFVLGLGKQVDYDGCFLSKQHDRRNSSDITIPEDRQTRKSQTQRRAQVNEGSA